MGFGKKQFGAFVCAVVAAVALGAGPGSAAADDVWFGIDADFSGMPMGGYVGGETIPYSIWVTIDDVENDGYDSQGLNGFVFDILTNTGILQGMPSYAATNSVYDYITVDDDVWLAGKGGIFYGGFGFSFINDLGNNSTVGDITGFGAFAAPLWDADVDDNISDGLEPRALQNIGIGSPPGIDVGGHQVPAMGARDKWYLAEGEISVPNAPGIYDVEVNPTSVALYRPDVDLNNDISSGLLLPTDPALTGDTFHFTVVPEPATLSVLLLAGAGVCIRRRR